MLEFIGIPFSFITHLSTSFFINVNYITVVYKWQTNVLTEKGGIMKITESFYTLTEVAGWLGVERHTIWRWVRSGKLPAQKAEGGSFY